MNFDQYIGQSIEVEDPSNAFQCMDWAFFICDKLAIPRAAIRNLYAKDVWNNHDKNYFSQSQNPTSGCFSVWGEKVGPAGHIAWAEGGTRDSFTSLDQNWNGVQHVTKEHHNNFGLLGFLIPKGEDMSARNMTKEEAQLLYTLAVPGRPVDDGWVKAWTDKDLGQAENALLNDPSIKSYRDSLLNSQDPEFTLVTDQLYKKKG